MSVPHPESIAQQQSSDRRVPAEWEAQEAIWLQWPGLYERIFEASFSKMAKVIVQYQMLHIITDNAGIEQRARAALASAGANPEHERVVWHSIPNDSAWMRDNGPVFVAASGGLRVQNWEFNAWGGAFGADIPYEKDNAVPDKVAEYLDFEVEHVDIVHERGNLEFNGQGAVIANWSVLGDPARNPHYSKTRAQSDFKRLFGASQVIFIEGIPETDLTKGHVDGIARFIDRDTVVVPQCTENSRCRPGEGKDDAVYDSAAETIRAAGFKVIRDPIEGIATFGGRTFDTNYTNWLVGNGFVLAVGFGNEAADAAAKSRIESYFPGRDVHMVEMLSSWAAGGGVHCHTNDQPAL